MLLLCVPTPRQRGGHLYQALVSDANLAGANLGYSTLRWTDLSRSDLSSAVLVGTVFAGAELTGAILDHAICQFTTFADVDLTFVSGLETVIHSGPSSISLDTLQQSFQALPPSFLRGVGLPESIVTAVHWMFLSDADQPSCVIDYSPRDAAFVRRLSKELRSHGIKVWLSHFPATGITSVPHPAGTAKRTVITILVLSKNRFESLPEHWLSGDVSSRIGGGNVQVLPILIDDDANETKSTWSRLLDTDRVVADFRGTQNRIRYREQLERLLEVLTSVQPDIERPKRVLLVGRYGRTRMQTLRQLKDLLSDNGYLPISANVVGNQVHEQLQFVEALSATAPWFAIVDLTRASELSKDLGEIFSNIVVPIQPIMQRSGDTERTLYSDFYQNPWVLPLQVFDEDSELEALFRHMLLERLESKAHQIEKMRHSGDQDG